jgi:hypothetical protein
VDIGQVPSLANLAGAAYSWDSHPSKTSAISQKSTTTRATAKSKEFFTFLFVNSVCDRQIVFLLGLRSAQTKSFQLQPTPVNQSQELKEKQVNLQLKSQTGLDHSLATRISMVGHHFLLLATGVLHSKYISVQGIRQPTYRPQRPTCFFFFFLSTSSIP